MFSIHVSGLDVRDRSGRQNPVWIIVSFAQGASYPLDRTEETDASRDGEAIVGVGFPVDRRAQQPWTFASSR